MKSIHYLLVVLLPAILNAADGKEFRMQFIDRDGKVYELKNQEDYLNVPVQHLQMASMVRNRRSHNVAQQQDLSDIELAEVSAAIEELEIETSKEYREWLKNNEFKVLCGIVCPPLLSTASGSALTYGALKALGLYGLELQPSYEASILSVGAGLGLGGLLFLTDKISEYIKPNQSEIKGQIKRLQDELENRKNK